MRRLRFSALFAIGWVLIAASLVAAEVLLNVTAMPPSGKTVVTVRLWDQQVAKAYRQSFAAFTRAHPDIEVQTHVVSYSTYFNTLRTDVAGGSADDIFWISNAYLDGYADSGRLMDIGKTFGEGVASGWEPSVVQQFTRNGGLWAVPQLTDGGIALYYNADLLAAAGVNPADLATLRWSPDGRDTLRPLLARLTVDADGRTAATPGFDAERIRKWAYNAANDAQGIYLNYIGSAGGVFQDGGRFAFDNPGAIE
ncbi:MAG: extracellular solute-binding protein, partial [Mycobacterium sp.]|nr:extracellular solute-binding protein [Mycobacterium sp.]